MSAKTVFAATISVALTLSSAGIFAAEGESLFDGASLAGWEGDAKWWRVEDGAITGEIPADSRLNQNQFLFWNGELHDFELRLQYRISGHLSANSGVQFRCQKTVNGAAGYQADLDAGATWLGRIYDEHGRALIVERGTRTIIGQAGERTVMAFRPAAEYEALAKRADWNDYRIRAIGPRMQVWVNGHLAADLTDNELGAHEFSGRLAIQLHSGPGPAKVQFRNIHLQSLGQTAPPQSQAPAPLAKRGGISPEGPNLGFEEGTLRGWKVEGEAWKGNPVEGDTVTPRRPGQASQHAGRFWVGGYERTNSDAGQGTLTSAQFEVTHPWGSFLVGGGSQSATRVELGQAADGKIFFTTSGREVEDMRAVAVDLTKLRGKKIFIHVVDESSGAWGHINFDDFRFHDKQPAAIQPPRRVSPVLQHLKPNPGDDPTGSGIRVPEGFRVDLIAREPEVTQPIAFTFDARGRLWVVEAHSYPQRQPIGEGRDRVVIFEDADADGTFETRKVFAEKLNLVSGIEVGFGGVWLGAAPHLLFIPDHDGDDVPDAKPEVLLDGWGYQDTHETPNSLTWGPDGWLYGNHGVFNKSLVGKPGTPADERVRLYACVWRYHPVRHEFEVFARGGSNQWGIDFNDIGHLFITHCRSFWGRGPTSFVVNGGHYWNQVNGNHASFVSRGSGGRRSRTGLQNFLLASAQYGHGSGGAGKPGTRAVYGGHSHVGTMVYLGDNWPEQFRDQLFTHNLHGRQMNRQLNLRSGSGYDTIHAGTDQLSVADTNFVGVDLDYGPDGAVYMIDWVDQQHCHSPHAERWDRSNGRIFRMAWSATFKPTKVNLQKLTDAELVELQSHKNDWFVRTARRLLQERAASGKLVADTNSRLHKLLGHREPRIVLRAIWALHATGGGTPEDLLRHESDVVRSWAVSLLAERPESDAQQLVQLARDDSSAMVRLALASALPRLTSHAQRWPLAEALAGHAEDNSDAYLPNMIWFGIGTATVADPARAMRLAKATPLTLLADSIHWYLGRYDAGRDHLAAHLKTTDAPQAKHTLRLLAHSLNDRTAAPPPARWEALSARLRRDGDAETQALLDQLGGIFGDADVLARNWELLADKTAPLAKRKAAFALLKSRSDTGSVGNLVALLDEPEFRAEVIPMLGRFNDAKAAAALISRLAKLRGAERFTALNVLSSQPLPARALLQAVRDQRLAKGELTALHIRQMHSLGDKKTTELLTGIWGKVGETSAEAKKSMAKFRKLYTEAPLWAFNANDGRAVFTKACATCHQLNGKGTAIGPDLTGSWRNGLDYFLESVIDPNAVVGEAFQLNIVTRKNDVIVAGTVLNETAGTLTIRTLTETLNVPRNDIKTQQVLEQSMMPPGLFNTLTERETITLLKFLTKRN
jgi:putative membrane-bound dehydrogenase-like protein